MQLRKNWKVLPPHTVLPFLNFRMQLRKNWKGKVGREVQGEGLADATQKELKENNKRIVLWFSKSPADATQKELKGFAMATTLFGSLLMQLRKNWKVHVAVPVQVVEEGCNSERIESEAS